jgi:dihydrodipicolinate reductase
MVVVAGASGRMGQAIIRIISGMPDVKLFGALEREGADTVVVMLAKLQNLAPMA